MACYDTGDFSCTYDSNAGAGKDYTSLGTWEGDTDNDLDITGYTVLKCFASQQHADGTTLSGASNTSEAQRREIISDVSVGFDGSAGSGADFNKAIGDGTGVFICNETFFRIENISVTHTTTRDSGAGIIIQADNMKCVKVVCYDGSNADGGELALGILAKENQNLLYGCIAYGQDGIAIQIGAGAGEDIGAIGCVGDAGSGTYGIDVSTSAGTAIAFSCYGHKGAGTAAFDGTFDAPSDYNVSEGDATSPGANSQDNTDMTGTMDANFLNTSNPTAYGRNPVNDVSASFDPDSFFTSPDGAFGTDIAGNVWSVVGDGSRDVGASEYVAAGGEEHEKALGDTMAMVDAIVKGVGQPQADTVALTDAIVHGYGMPQSDAVAMSDAIVKSFGQAQADTMGLTDAQTKAIGLPLADTTALTDAITKSVGLPLGDTISIADLLINGFGLNVADVVGLADAIVMNFGLALSDVISLTDANDLETTVYALYNFIANNKTFNFNAENKAFNFNAKNKVFNFNAEPGP